MSRLTYLLIFAVGILVCFPLAGLAQWDDETWDEEYWETETFVKRPGFVFEGALPIPRAHIDEAYEGDYGYGVSVVLTKLDFGHWRPVSDKIRLRYTEDWMILKDDVVSSLNLTDAQKRARLWGVTVGSGSAGKFVGGKKWVVSGYHGTFLGLYGLELKPAAFSALGDLTASPLNEENNQGQFGFSNELALRFTTRHVGMQVGYEFVEVKRALVFWPAAIHGVIQGFAMEAMPEFLSKYAGHGWAVQVCSWAWRIAVSAGAHHLQSYHTDWPYDRERPLLMQRWKAGLMFYL